MKQAYTIDSTGTHSVSNKKVWDVYMPYERAAYSYILTEKVNHIEGTVKEIGEKLKLSPMYTIAFIDGINEALDKQIEINELNEESQVVLDFTFENLYRKMVDYKADTLYTMDEWKNVFDEDKLTWMFKDQRQAGTFRREGAKIGRNDPCPCGSGRKYKQCCGKNKTA